MLNLFSMFAAGFCAGGMFNSLMLGYYRAAFLQAVFVALNLAMVYHAK